MGAHLAKNSYYSFNIPPKKKIVVIDFIASYYSSAACSYVILIQTDEKVGFCFYFSYFFRK